MINQTKPEIWIIIRDFVRGIIPPRVRWLRRVITNREPKFIRKHGAIVFIAWHPILDQLSQEIILGLDSDLNTKVPTTVYVGIHGNPGLSWFRRGLKIGIQTEQLYDAEGVALFGLKKGSWDFNIRWGYKMADQIIDLSENNRKFYEEDIPRNIRKKAEVVFGPHIFPSKKIPFRHGGTNLIFFGSVPENNRRAGIIRRMKEMPVRMVPDGTYGEELYALIDQSQGVLNVHYEDAVYTEAPRLLTAYLRGKVVFSEPLDNIFLPGVDYIALGEGGDASEIFENFSEKVTTLYSFSALLNELCESYVDSRIS